MENEARKYWFTALLFALSALICLWLGIFFIVQPPKESVMLSDNSATTGATTTSAERTVAVWRTSNDKTGVINTLLSVPGLGSDPGDADPAGHAIYQSIGEAELYGQVLVYTVTININTSGYGTVKLGSGNAQSSVQVSNVPYGTVLSGTTTATLTFGNGLGSVTASATTATAQYSYSFSSWSEIPSNGIITGDTTITANFSRATRSYALTVTAGAGGSVSGGGTYNYGTSVTITATASTGYTFTKWSDGNTTASRSITVTGAATYTATFTANTYTISYTMNSGTHNGSWATSYTFSTSSQTKSIGTASRTCYSGSVSTSKGSISGSTLTIPASATGNITVTWTWTQWLSLGTLTADPLKDFKYFSSNGVNWVIIGYYNVSDMSFPNAVSKSEVGAGNVLCLSQNILYSAQWGRYSWSCEITSSAIQTWLSNNGKLPSTTIQNRIVKQNLKSNKAAGSNSWTASDFENNASYFLLGTTQFGGHTFRVEDYLNQTRRVIEGTKWWTRDGNPNVGYPNGAAAVRSDGVISQASDQNYSYGVRPAFVLKVQ